MNPGKLEKIASLVNYDRETGFFYWKETGERAEISHPKGYLRVKKSGVDCLAHRLAWFMEFGIEPNNHIDHKNGVKNDNRISNLREATNAENHRNVGAQKNCTSGVPGVALNNRKTAWMAYIKHLGVRIHLGTYKLFGDAVKARQNAERLYFGEYGYSASRNIP